MDNTLLTVDAIASGKLSTDPRSAFYTDEYGNLKTQSTFGRFREATHRDHRFSVTNAGIGGQAVSVGLATTYTGLYLWNPAGSGVNLSIDAITTSLLVAEVAISQISLGRIVAGGMTTETSSITPTSCLVGSATGAIAHAGYAATIVAPVLLFPLVGGALATAFPYKSGPEYLEGLYEVKPNYGVCIIATTAVTGHFAFVWTEIPI
jgi:hypothetical protein